jgi:hypothetical protein
VGSITEYHHVNSQKRNNTSPSINSGYVQSSGGSGSTSGSPTVGNSMNTSRAKSPGENDGNQNTSDINKQRTDNSSSANNSDQSSKRKFRKRK